VDSISSPELAKIFGRLPAAIELKGATDAAELERRMQFYIDVQRARAMIAKREKTKDANIWRAEQIDKLIEHEFPERVIREALRQPRGLIAQTLLHGKAEAKRRVLAYRRARIAAGYPTVGVRQRVPSLPTIPETRRMRAWRRMRK
jgi:hypothetical protein